MTLTRLCLLFCSVSCAFSQNLNSIAGIAVDASTGKPLAGVILTAVKSGLPPFSANVRSDIAGLYLLAGLPAGTYTICAHFVGDGYLDPCQWNTIPPTVTVVAGKVITENTVKLIPGSVLHVRIQDLGQLMSAKTAAGQAADLALGVWGAKSLFHPAHLVSTDAGGADYQLTIPRDTFVQLHIRSQALKLTDATGAALPQNSFQQRFQSRTAEGDWIADVERPCDPYQNLGEIGIDPPVMRLVGVAQSGARHLATQTHVIKLSTHGSKARLDVAQTLAIRQLSETHRQ